MDKLRHQTNFPIIRQFASLPRHRWFSPLLVIGLAAVYYLGFLFVQFLGCFIWAAIVDGGGGNFNTALDSMFDFNNVSGVVFGMTTVILMWPAVELAVLSVYRQWFWPMISAERGPEVCGAQSRGMRWGLLGRFLLLSVPVWVVCGAVMVAFSPGPMGNLSTGVIWNQHVMAMLIAMLLLVPFQAMSEEIVFRGLAMNAVGSWLRHPAWAVLIPVPFFVFGHIYDLPGLIDVGIFAVVAGVLTLYTGGLEAGIAFHIVNNLFAFILGILAGSDLNATSSPTIEVVMSIAAPIAFAGLVVLDTCRRRDAARVSAIAAREDPRAERGQVAGHRNEDLLPNMRRDFRSQT